MAVGSGSWLGANVVILPGAVLGQHVVVAAGAVVRGVFPDRCVVAGVPARMVRRWLPDRGWVDVGRGSPADQPGADQSGADQSGADQSGTDQSGASRPGAPADHSSA